jgi:hypothetical protein
LEVSTFSSPGQSQPIAVDKIGEDQLIVILPRSNVQFADDGSQYLRYELTFKSPSHSWNPFSQGKVVKRELIFWKLPKIMAHYIISPTIKISLPVEHTSFWADLSPHGKDGTFPAPVSVPPDMVANDWIIDTNALLSLTWANPKQSGGSSCTGVDRNTVTPTGFVYDVQLGHNSSFLHMSDGMAVCEAAVPVMRARTTTGPGQIVEGDLNWTDDANPYLPSGTQKYTIKLKMFDGRSYLITDDANVPYGVVEIQRQGNTSVLFRPHPPSDF